MFFEFTNYLILACYSVYKAHLTVEFITLSWTTLLLRETEKVRNYTRITIFSTYIKHNFKTEGSRLFIIYNYMFLFRFHISLVLNYSKSMPFWLNFQSGLTAPHWILFRLDTDQHSAPSLYPLINLEEDIICH